MLCVPAQVLVAAARGVPGKHRCLVRVVQVRPEVGAMTTHRSWMPAMAGRGAHSTYD